MKPKMKIYFQIRIPIILKLIFTHPLIKILKISTQLTPLLLKKLIRIMNKKIKINQIYLLKWLIKSSINNYLIIHPLNLIMKIKKLKINTGKINF